MFQKIYWLAPTDVSNLEIHDKFQNQNRVLAAGHGQAGSSRLVHRVSKVEDCNFLREVASECRASMSISRIKNSKI